MMASELRMKLINMKGEGSSRQKEEANIVLQVLWNSHKITQDVLLGRRVFETFLGA